MNKLTTRCVASSRVLGHGFWLAAVSLVLSQPLVFGQAEEAVGTTPTSVAVTSSTNPSILGRSVTLKATVTPSAATGKVTFYDGTSVLGIVALSNGKAQINTVLLPAGKRSITVFYPGDTTYAVSTSPVFTQTVTAVPGNGFLTAVPYPASDQPVWIVMSDFNGDGKADIAVANYFGSGQGGRVSVMLGNGDGTFQAPVSIATDLLSTSVVAVDMNGDGKVDLAVTNSNSGNMSVLLGNGDGTFGHPVKVPTGFGPTGIEAGDLNHDGKADLVLADSNGVINVFLGNGDGTFQNLVQYTVGTNPTSVAIGDFNGDGKNDVAVANMGTDTVPSTTVSVLLGNGDGTLQPAISYSAGMAPRFVVTGDFNGDGKADLAVANNQSLGFGAGVSILLGDGLGGFAAPVTYQADSFPFSLALGDFNGDGKTDIAVANNGQSGFGNNVSVLLGNGDGTFQLSTEYAAGNAPSGVAVADVNLDGRSDILVTNQGDNTVSVLLAGSVPSPLTLSPTSLTFGTETAGITSNAKGVTITNTGTTPITMSSFIFSGDFRLSSNSCPASLAAGANCLVRARFSPTGGGPRTGYLSITDSAPDSPQLINLSGTGLFFTVTPSTLNFGNQTVGTTSTPQTITVMNVAVIAGNVQNVTNTGPNPRDFTVTNNCPKSEAAGGTCTISITFTPKVAGSRSATISLTAGGQLFTVPLSGTGI